MMAANLINARLLRRIGSERMFRLGFWIMATSAVVLLLDVLAAPIPPKGVNNALRNPQ